MSIETPYSRKSRNGKVFAGLVLLAVGGLLLLKQLDIFFFPYWLFRWPVYLIVFGLYIGAKHDFRKPSWLLLVGLGVIFLIQPYVYIPVWPLILIVLGLWMIFKRNHTPQRVTWDARMNATDTGTLDDTYTTEPLGDEYTKEKTYTKNPYGNDDFFDCTSIFSGAKRVVLSKTFKGGDIVNLFGGTEIDLSQADINGRVLIDITQLFGGVKLVVPPHWQVVPELAAVFSNVDDKRKTFGAVQQSPDKVLVLKGTSIFAGVDIRSY